MYKFSWTFLVSSSKLYTTEQNNTKQNRTKNVHFDFGSTLVRLKSDIIPTIVKKILKNMCDENFSKLSFSTLVELKCMHT